MPPQPENRSRTRGGCPLASLFSFLRIRDLLSVRPRGFSIRSPAEKRFDSVLDQLSVRRFTFPYDKYFPSTLSKRSQAIGIPLHGGRELRFPEITSGFR